MSISARSSTDGLQPPDNDSPCQDIGEWTTDAIPKDPDEYDGYNEDEWWEGNEEEEGQGDEECEDDGWGTVWDYTYDKTGNLKGWQYLPPTPHPEPRPAKKAKDGTPRDGQASAVSGTSAASTAAAATAAPSSATARTLPSKKAAAAKAAPASVDDVEPDDTSNSEGETVPTSAPAQTAVTSAAQAEEKPRTPRDRKIGEGSVCGTK